MSVISWAAATFGFAADSATLGMSVAQILNSTENTTGPELFAKCFRTAVKRRSPGLAKAAGSKSPSAIKVYEAGLKTAIKSLEEREFATRGREAAALLEDALPLFQTAVIVDDHRLPDQFLRSHLLPILNAAVQDFFVRLPSHPAAVATIGIAHVHCTEQEHANHEKLLNKILTQLASRQDEVKKDSTYLDPTVIAQALKQAKPRSAFLVVGKRV